MVSKRDRLVKRAKQTVREPSEKRLHKSYVFETLEGAPSEATPGERRPGDVTAAEPVPPDDPAAPSAE